MNRKIIFALALFATSVTWTTPSFAEGALAVGMPQGDPNNGFRWALRVNNPDAAAEAMKTCRASRNPKVGATCMLIGTFSDQCVAVAVNGDADAPVTAAGWAIAPDSASATRRAIAQCEMMRNGRGKPCQIDGDSALRCDGSAR